jgi:hypothetical protein
VEIKEYIESGVLEAYILGSASEKEINELHQLKGRHPQIQDALDKLQDDLECIAQHMAITPPPEIWNRIEDEVNELTKRDDADTLKITINPKANGKDNTGEFVEVQGPSSHMRVHKIWRWILGAIFILGKIFLAFAIYYYLESRQTEAQIQELKQELKRIKSK